MSKIYDEYIENHKKNVLYCCIHVLTFIGIVIYFLYGYVIL